MPENTVSRHLANLGKFALCVSTGHFGMALFPAIGIGAGLITDKLDKDHPLSKAAVGVLSSVCGNLTTSSAQNLANALRKSSNHDLERVAIAALRAALQHSLQELDSPRNDGEEEEGKEIDSIFDQWFKRIDRGLSSESELDALVGTQFPIDSIQTLKSDDKHYWTFLSDSLRRWIGEVERFKVGIVQVSLDLHGRQLPSRLEHYLEVNLPELTRKAVTQVLREPEHVKGWIAWQQRLLEELATQTRPEHPKLAKQLSEIASQAEALQAALVEKLDKMGFKLDEIVHDVKSVKTTGEETNKSVKRVEIGVTDLKKDMSGLRDHVSKLTGDNREGIARTLAQRAEIPPNPDLLNSLFHRLVTIENRGGQRKPVFHEARHDQLVASAAGDPSAAADLVERLVTSRLFFEHDGLIGIAYEPLPL